LIAMIVFLRGPLTTAAMLPTRQTMSFDPPPTKKVLVTADYCIR